MRDKLLAAFFLLALTSFLFGAGFLFGRMYVIMHSEAYVTDHNNVVMMLDGRDYFYVANVL